MTHRTLIALTLLAGAALTGCDRAVDAAPSDLERDLQMISGSGTGSLELAPSGRATQVVSEIEGGRAAPAPSPQPMRSAAARRPAVSRPSVARAQPAPTPAPAAPAVADEAEFIREAPVEADRGVPTRRPVAAPQGAGPAPAGGWKTIDQIAPRLPFPIKP